MTANENKNKFTLPNNSKANNVSERLEELAKEGIAVLGLDFEEDEDLKRELADAMIDVGFVNTYRSPNAVEIQLRDNGSRISNHEFYRYIILVHEGEGKCWEYYLNEGVY